MRDVQTFEKLDKCFGLTVFFWIPFLKYGEKALRIVFSSFRSSLSHLIPLEVSISSPGSVRAPCHPLHLRVKGLGPVYLPMPLNRQSS